MLGLLLFAAVAPAQPTKMLVTTAHGTAITDYSSMEQCARARRSLLIAWRVEQERKATLEGFKIVSLAPITIVCFQ
jgi:hypothetical protein